jgi:hypothetical protein
MCRTFSIPHFLPSGLIASEMSFNLFVKRSNPAAQSLPVALDLFHLIIWELVGNRARFLFEL